MPAGNLFTVPSSQPIRIGYVPKGGRILAAVSTGGATLFLGSTQAGLALIGGNNQGIPVPQTSGAINMDWSGDLWAICDQLHVSLQAEIVIQP